MDDQLLTTSAAALRLGLSDSQFRNMAKRLKLSAARYYANPNHRSGPKCPLWNPAEVNALVGGPAVTVVLERARRIAEGKKAKPAERRKALERRYPDWRSALPVAADAMFNLNRYTKWPNCSPKNREEIYSLKNSFVRLLYAEGHCSGTRLHTTERPGQTCKRCQGSGQDDDGDCERCDGSGWWKPPLELRFVVFQFTVGDKGYCWHQPEELVNWHVTSTAETESWEGEQTVKPLNLPARKFADLKALLRFVLASHSRPAVTVQSSKE